MPAWKLPPPPPGYQPPPRAKRRVWPWVLLGFFVLGIGGCGVMAIAIDKAVDDLNAEQASHAITQEQFDAVPLGITRSALETQLGLEPENAQEFVSKGVVSGDEIRSSCVYYNRVGESFGSRFQFCFDGDSLRSKNSY